MVQLDGSHHDWFEKRAPQCVLMVMVDDATGRVWAQFFEEETTRGQLRHIGGLGAAMGFAAELVCG